MNTAFKIWETQRANLCLYSPVLNASKYIGSFEQIKNHILTSKT